MKPLETRDDQQMLCAEIVSEHGRSVSRLVGALLRNVPSCSPWDVDDVVQTTFLRLHLTVLAGRLDPSRSVASYLKTIARNVTRDLIRTESSRERLRAGSWPFGGEPFDAARDVSIDQVSRCVEELPCSLRAIYELRFERGLSQTLTARRLSCSRQNVRTLEATSSTA